MARLPAKVREVPGVDFNLTADGNYDIVNKKIGKCG